MSHVATLIDELLDVSLAQLSDLKEYAQALELEEGPFISNDRFVTGKRAEWSCLLLSSRPPSGRRRSRVPYARYLDFAE
ncbi:hypothetical protein ACPOL_6891 (plasmid) [Acidisarcina polymorpha]|uniref:Uncharacterized protein n=1 Tax=Acidisarcina polymorpha TaxID=2211140 RepID=A0A2Z5GAS9_9BACT|nr:hypothetical protein [Acidisarcina polymorpha]AXC16099.1 hypothetical protein ACPOL_6891 [Acidisarcina polymorpha]